MTLMNIFFLVSQVAALTTPIADGTALGGYPAIYSVPPTNSQWTSALLGGKTITGAPRPKGMPAIYSAGDVMLNCGSNYGTWGLTFDDGPGPYTGLVLNDLTSKKLKATFFQVGSVVIQFSTTQSRVFNDGHELALHSWSHPYLTNLTNDQIVAELVWNAKAIYDLTGRVPRYVRPPYADVDSRVIQIFKAIGLVPILWDFDSYDYNLNAPATTTQTAIVNNVKNAANGNPHISLEHDLFMETATVASNITSAILGSGKYSVVPASKCISTQDSQGPYLTSGTFYQLVTGFNSSSTNPTQTTPSNPDGTTVTFVAPTSTGILFGGNAGSQFNPNAPPASAQEQTQPKVQTSGAGKLIASATLLSLMSLLL